MGKEIELSTAITDIAAGPFGSNLKVECFVPSGFPIIDGANLKGYKVTDNITKFVTEEKARSLSRSIAHRGDVIVTISGTIGQIAYIPEDSLYDEYLCSQRQFRVSFDSSMVYVPYLVFYFHTFEGQNKILSFANQTGVPALSQPLKNFKKIRLCLPSLQEQRRIASIVETINDKIENNIKINENLEQQISALYESWFENFDLTNGVCPESWNNQELSTITEISNGKRPPIKAESCSKETPIPIVGAASVMGFTSEANHTDKILVTGRVGTHGVVQRFNTPCWTSDNTLVIKSSYYEFTNQILQRIDYSAMNRGSTQPLITQGDMKKVSILLPDVETLAKFETFAGTMMNQWEANKQENVKLASLRDTLLPKLMSGELDVSDIDL